MATHASGPLAGHAMPASVPALAKPCSGALFRAAAHLQPQPCWASAATQPGGSAICGPGGYWRGGWRAVSTVAIGRARGGAVLRLYNDIVQNQNQINPFTKYGWIYIKETHDDNNISHTFLHILTYLDVISHRNCVWRT